MTESPGHLAARLANVERLPEHVHYIPTHHLDPAISDIGHAEHHLAENRLVQARLHIERAQERVMYARQSLKSTSARWRDYNERLDRVIAWIDAHPDALGDEI